MENSPKDFFISYNKADVFWGEWIAWQLEAAGYSVSIQAWDFRPGQNFVIGMNEAAAEARHTIAILSPDYLQALFTQPEWAAAFVQDPTGHQRTLIPVRVRECDLKGLLAAIIYIDLIDLEEDIARQRLIEGVSAKRTKPDNPPSFPGKKSATSSETAVESVPLVPKPAYPRHSAPVKQQINVFMVADSKDKKHLDRLEKQLITLKKQGWISTWNSGLILAGHEIIPEIEAHWEASQLILLLISADSLNSSYDLIERAEERRKNGTARVIQIILRPCMWDFDTQTVLPASGKPITSHADPEEAFTEVALGIRAVVKDLLK